MKSVIYFYKRRMKAQFQGRSAVFFSLDLKEDLNFRRFIHKSKQLYRQKSLSLLSVNSNVFAFQL